jgi:hypothetical protein
MLWICVRLQSCCANWPPKDRLRTSSRCWSTWRSTTVTTGLLAEFRTAEWWPPGSITPPRATSARNCTCISSAVQTRELGLATGRPAFTVVSLLHEASKFELQWQNAEPIRLVVAGEEILILGGCQVVLRVDEASFLRASPPEGLLRVGEELQRELGVRGQMD